MTVRLPANIFCFLWRVSLANSKLIQRFEKMLNKGVEKGVFNDKDPFITANIIVYLLSFAALRGWNLKKRCAEELNKYIKHFVMTRLTNGS